MRMQRLTKRTFVNQNVTAWRLSSMLSPKLIMSSMLNESKAMKQQHCVFKKCKKIPHCFTPNERSERSEWRGLAERNENEGGRWGSGSKKEKLTSPHARVTHPHQGTYQDERNSISSELGLSSFQEGQDVSAIIVRFTCSVIVIVAVYKCSAGAYV